jgi:8-oxo-dGTP diphosphatase
MDIPCVGAIIHDAERRLVVVRRGRQPNKGLWSIPGGRVEAGESDQDAVRREVREETGLQVDVIRSAGSVVLAAPAAADRYLVTDYLAVVTPGTSTDLRAGDDAVDARWVSESAFLHMEVTPGLAGALRQWGVWAAPSG